MKKIKFSKKLLIEKTTVALLDENQLRLINGGVKTTTKGQATAGTCLCTWTCPYPTANPPCNK